jgi:hypothetical protein
MKKYIYTFITVGAILFSACKNESPNYNLSINGTIDGFKQGKIYLFKVQDTIFSAIDSVVVKGNPEFNFNLNIDSPEMLFLALDRGHSKSIDNQIPFFAEPGNIEIHTTLKNFFSDAKITGSETNDTYQEYLKTRALITDRQNQLLVEVFNADKEKDAAKLDSLSAINKKLTARQYLNAVNFALNHNSSDVAPYIALTELYDRNIKYLDAIYNSLTDKTATNKYGQQLKEYIEERKAEHITE